VAKWPSKPLTERVRAQHITLTPLGARGELPPADGDIQDRSVVDITLAERKATMKQVKATLVHLPIFICFVLIAGCGGHDTSTLPESLIGHWVTESGNTHYYFDSTSVVMVDKGRRMDQSYTVLELNEAENWMKIRVRTGYERGHDKRLEFLSDRKTLTEIVEMSVIQMRTRWDYVDSKKAP
jgi:hypothetical protein